MVMKVAMKAVTLKVKVSKVAKKPARSDVDVSDATEATDATEAAVESVEPPTTNPAETLKSRVPPAIRRWLNGSEGWTKVQSQGLKDWSQSLRTHGNATAADAVDGVRNKSLAVKQSMASKLSLVKSEADLKLFEEEENSELSRDQRTEGLMTPWEIFGLLNVPITSDTATIRKEFLATLGEPVKDSSKIGGILYHYSHKHAQTHFHDYSKKHTLSGVGKVKDEAEWESVSKMMRSEADRTKNASGAEPSSHSTLAGCVGRHNAKAKAKGAKRTLDQELEEFPLGANCGECR